MTVMRLVESVHTASPDAVFRGALERLPACDHAGHREARDTSGDRAPPIITTAIELPAVGYG
jgi:hypothetical protein